MIRLYNKAAIMAVAKRFWDNPLPHIKRRPTTKNKSYHGMLGIAYSADVLPLGKTRITLKDDEPYDEYYIEWKDIMDAVGEFLEKERVLGDKSVQIAVLENKVNDIIEQNKILMEKIETLEGKNI